MTSTTRDRSILSLAAAFLAGLLAAGCAPGDVAPPELQAPLFDDLGDQHHPITTSSSYAQQFFDQGLRLVYAFNHAEAIRAFREAARLDPTCAMCYWGVALALGPNINMPMAVEDVGTAYEAVQKALDLAGGASDVERVYIEALAARYAAEPPEDRTALDKAYADAMRDVARRYPEDLDASTLFAESLMDLSPWDYYFEDGRPKAETEEVIAALERVLAANPGHPGALHYYIHAVEATATAERAEAPADRLATLMPGAGHLVHMPSHIYLRLGRYADASAANERAAAADETYIAQCKAQGFYPAMYYPHNIHFLWYSSTLEGRRATALDAATKLVANLNREMVAELPEALYVMPSRLFSMVRFGQWEDVLREPAPPGDIPYENAMWRYARTLAFAGTGQLEEARSEAAHFASIAQAGPVIEQPSAAPLYAALMELAGHVLEGEVARIGGKSEGAIAHFEQAVAVQDQLPYMEPPYWYFPVRQYLGAALLDAKRPVEAEAVFREDLGHMHTPRNGWSLYGLELALRAQGKAQEAEETHRQFEQAWTLADVELTTSRF